MSLGSEKLNTDQRDIKFNLLDVKQLKFKLFYCLNLSSFPDDEKLMVLVDIIG